MSMTKFKTIKRTRKSHNCYECCKRIEIGSTCTKGVTTDKDIVQNNGLLSVHFCTGCRDILLNQ